jgi:membrane-associated protease RseP (regulator of RpoE activity)
MLLDYRFVFVIFSKGINMLKLNVGGVDRVLRIVVGIALIAATLMGWINAFGWIGVVPLLTGIFRFCPAYALLGIKTCKLN